MSLGDDFVLTLFTNDIALAKRADEAGIDRVGLDLESIGKKERQNPQESWISDHKISQLPEIGGAIRNAKLFARTNPIHKGSNSEIDILIESGAQVLMLPMFRTAQEVDSFVEMVRGRAEVSLLLETKGAAANVEDIVKVAGIDEIHVGLNDLHLEMGMKNHFQILVSPLIEHLSNCVRSAGLPFGFGGIGRANDTSLLVPSSLVYAQYPRLKADRALVSRVFLAPNAESLDLRSEVKEFRGAMNCWSQVSIDGLLQEKSNLTRKIDELFDG